MVVAQDGRFVWEQSWGFANVEGRVPATPQTMYSLASISKAITATGLMLLVERGQVDLDRPIEDYLGGLTLRAHVGDTRQATVRRVANHTGGLPIHEYSVYADEGRVLPPFNEIVRRYGILVRPPGERFEYSNLGYGLLEQTISHTAKRDFEVFMREDVFEPLRLSHMALGPNPRMTRETAARYARDGSVLPFYEMDARGASSFYASAHDLARFAFLHLRTLEAGQRRILSDASLEAMTRSSRGSPFGIGWQLDNRLTSPIVYSTGHMDGVGAILLTVPAKRLVIVGLANAGHDVPARAAFEVLRRMYPDLNFSPPSAPPEAPLPSALVGEWTGAIEAYSGNRPFRLWIDGASNVYAQLGDEPRVQVENPRWLNGQFVGSLRGDLGVDDAGAPQRLGFSLISRDGGLDGRITAWTTRRNRIGNALSSFLSLRQLRTSGSPIGASRK